MDVLKTLEMTTIVPLSKTIEQILESESKYIPVASVCKSFKKQLANGVSENELCESFIEEFSKVATHNSAKKRLFELVSLTENQKTNLKYANIINKMKKGALAYGVPNIENVMVNYMCEKNSETRAKARQVLELFATSKDVAEILETMKYEEYEEKSGKSLVNITLNETAEAPKSYTEDEVNAIIAQKLEEQKTTMAEEAKKVEKKTIASIDTHIGLHGAIKSILDNSNGNTNLIKVCEDYMNALNSGKAEEVLYEDFISAISPWNYMSAVDTQISAIKDRTSKYKQDIDLKKILEVMKETGSYYIVPLIEDMVVEYCNNKSLNTMALLKQRLFPFEYDNFVRDILNIVANDQSYRNSVYLGESVETVNRLISTEHVFSPLHFIKENECVFNVKGAYYAKRGNSLNKLTAKDVESLPASFKHLCDVVNSDNVVINEALNTISVYEGNHTAVISEISITIDKTPVDSKDLKNMEQTAVLMREGSENFYRIVNLINENFNNIAYIDFVKHISQKVGDRSADVFRLKDSLYVNTVNESLGKSTFYRNINPIQLQHHLNEHMEINVSSLFEDILPNQDQVKKNIDETKNQYECYLTDLKNKRKELEEMSLEADNTEDIENAIKSIDDEIENTEKEYKEYREKTDKFLTGDGDDDTTPDDENGDTTDTTDKAENPDENPENGEETADTETPEEMAEPIDGEFADATEYDPTFDAVDDEAGFKIVKVSFNKNVKSNKVSNYGEAFILIPTVDANGDVHNDTKKVTFYVDKATNNIVINNEYMPLDMYKAIEKAVKDDPNTANINYDTEVPAENVTNYGNDYDNQFDDLFADNANGVASITVTDTPAEETPETPVETAPVTTEVPAEETPAEDVPTEESPAETAEVPTEESKTECVHRSAYPVSISLDTKDLRPMPKDRFLAALDGMGIEHNVIEGVADGVCFVCKNDTDVKGLRRFFGKDKGYTAAQFDNFFPELKECGKTSPTNESVKINKVFAINESAILSKDSKGCVTVMLPNTKEMRSLFECVEEKGDLISLKTENYDETKNVYESLSEYAYRHENVSEDITNFIEANKSDFRDIYESYRCYNLNVPFSNMLKQKLESKGIHTYTVNEELAVSIRPADNKKAVKVFTKFYGEELPESVKGFVKDVNEGVVITVKDDSTGKTVTIDTSKIDDNNDMPTDSTEPTNFGSSFDNVTFNPEDSLLYQDNTEEDDKDDKDKESDDDKKEKKDKKEEQNESEETPEVKDDEEGKSEKDEPKEDEKKDTPKKKFKFKPVKKGKAKNESAETKDGENLNESLNESAGIAVYDNVTLKDGTKGQVVGHYNDNFIVSVMGHTVVCKENEMNPLNQKSTMEMPYKFDKDTLKAVFESKMVRCGMFMNNVQITPSDCYVKFSDYVNASDNDNINIVIEGETTEASKKYIRLCESIDITEYAIKED